MRDETGLLVEPVVPGGCVPQAWTTSRCGIRICEAEAANGNDAALQYAEIYAQWGDWAKALDWLDSAMRLRDPGLEFLKTDPLMDPLRDQPRFQAVIRQLKFPE